MAVNWQQVETLIHVVKDLAPYSEFSVLREEAYAELQYLNAHLSPNPMLKEKKDG